MLRAWSQWFRRTLACGKARKKKRTGRNRAQPSRAMRRRLELESLEDRFLPSSMPIAASSPGMAAAALQAHVSSLPPAPTPSFVQQELSGFVPGIGPVTTTPRLWGQGHGTYSVHRTFINFIPVGNYGPTAGGMVYDLQGVANLNFAPPGTPIVFFSLVAPPVTVTGSLDSRGFMSQGRAAGTLTFTNAFGSYTMTLEGPEQSSFAPLQSEFSYKVVAATGMYRQLADQQGSLHLDLVAAANAPRGTFTMTIASKVVQQEPLAGAGHGNYSKPFTIPDVGATYNMQGVADLAPLGQVAVTGSIHSLGFISAGQAAGTLTFINAQGSVTVSLLGPVQPGFAPLPSQFQYRVMSGTGAYQDLSDQGSLQLDLVPDLAGPSSPAGQGTFQLTLD
jgi:hypothetical protein